MNILTVHAMNTMNVVIVPPHIDHRGLSDCFSLSVCPMTSAYENGSRNNGRNGQLHDIYGIPGDWSFRSHTSSIRLQLVPSEMKEGCRRLSAV